MSLGRALVSIVLMLFGLSEAVAQQPEAKAAAGCTASQRGSANLPDLHRTRGDGGPKRVAGRELEPASGDIDHAVQRGSATERVYGRNV
jgi:hypothetical protein